MMKIQIVILFLLLSSLGAIGQDTLSNRQPTAPYTGRVQIKLAPLAAIGNQFPVFVEVLLSKYFSVELRGGPGRARFRTIENILEPDPINEFRETKWGYSAGFGLRSYPINFSAPFQGVYVELRADYFRYNNSLNFSDLGFSIDKSMDEHHQRFNGQLNFGFSVPISTHFTTELSLGLGATQININGYQYNENGPVQIFAIEETRFVRPLLTMSLKVGFCFNCMLLPEFDE